MNPLMHDPWGVTLKADHSGSCAGLTVMRKSIAYQTESSFNILLVQRRTCKLRICALLARSLGFRDALGFRTNSEGCGFG